MCLIESISRKALSSFMTSVKWYAYLQGNSTCVENQVVLRYYNSAVGVRDVRHYINCNCNVLFVKPMFHKNINKL